MIKNRQEWLLEHSKRVGDNELLKKMTWLSDNDIELNDWQLVRFTGYDRGIGKTYVSMCLNMYNETESSSLDSDANRSIRSEAEYLRTLKAFKKSFKN